MQRYYFENYLQKILSNRLVELLTGWKAARYSTYSWSAKKTLAARPNWIAWVFVGLVFVCTPSMGQQVVILGVAQDGGYPHIGCAKACCRKAWQDESRRNHVVSFALVDTLQASWWLFEATPDITRQLERFQQLTGGAYRYLPDGIFLSHAHIGHYTGLMYLGREALNASQIPVYTLPKFADFLRTNGPWSQLVLLNNISLKPLQPDQPLHLNETVSVTAFTVPHRDEFSETAGFSIRAGTRKILFIPDIDKWAKWNKSIIDEVKRVDMALLDATFSSATELPNRKISEVPHPLVSETVSLFNAQDQQTRQKVYFIHFNHTNPLLWDEQAQADLLRKGFHLATLGAIL